MGVCVFPEQFKELNFDYDYKKVEEEKLNKYMQNQKIITVNEFK